jgi:hypothetical protein
MIFTKLRNAFLLLSLITISVLMFAAFAAIYTMTYVNISVEIDRELERIADARRHPGDIGAGHVAEERPAAGYRDQGPPATALRPDPTAPGGP